MVPVAVKSAFSFCSDRQFLLPHPFFFWFGGKGGMSEEGRWRKAKKFYCLILSVIEMANKLLFLWQEAKLRQ
jgi:hypothetical protein